MLVDEKVAVVIPTEAYAFALSYSAFQQSIADGSSGHVSPEKANTELSSEFCTGEGGMWSRKGSVAIKLLSPSMQDANLSSEVAIQGGSAGAGAGSSSGVASPFVQDAILRAPQLASFPYYLSTAMSERARLVSSDKKDPAIVTLHTRIVAGLSAFMESKSGGLALLLLVPRRLAACFPATGALLSS